MLSAQSQLLERNLELFDEGEWLLINPADAYFTDLLTHRPLAILHQYFDVFSESAGSIAAQSLDSRDVATSDVGFCLQQQVGKHLHLFTPFVDKKKSFTDVLIYLPKAKAQLAMLLQMAASVLTPGGRIHLVGENKGGIKSADKLTQRYGTTEKVDSARHCSLLTTHLENPVAFAPTDWIESNTFTIADTELDVVSMPGVFSHNELDDGTELLLHKLPSSLRNKVLDFACGAGVIGAHLKQQYPHFDVTLLDVSALALYCAARTLKANQLTGTLIAANGLHGVDSQFNHIITNPPFHTGIKTDYSITKRFISDSRRILAKSGSLYMVANRFLPYPGLLAEQFSQVRTLAQTSRFSVYLVLA
ncbi:methyltransferase [Salinimonas marina]|nr:methyltransferase [Salinimonas marina]